MVEKEVTRRVFRVTAKVESINYASMTLDYIPVDGKRKAYNRNYCRILNDEQAVILYSALIHERCVKLLINHKFKIDEKKTTWFELVEVEEIWDK